MAKCDQCDSCYINGIFCHETGCPNSNWRPRVARKRNTAVCPYCGETVSITVECKGSIACTDCAQELEERACTNGNCVNEKVRDGLCRQCADSFDEYNVDEAYDAMTEG